LRFKSYLEQKMRIGVLADRTGASVPTIRYYEEIGLLRRAAFIRRCREFDFSIEQIRALLSLLHSDGSCTEARLAAEGHLAAIRSKIVALSTLEKTITSLISACTTTCDGGAASGCVILTPA
jgi:DNA-binding transcriptional MerR regulator